MSEVKLLVTDECRRLARWLRLMGYDTALMPARPLPQLYRTAVNEHRVVITRNQCVRPGRLMRVVQLAETALDAQLRQLVQDAGLSPSNPQRFTRCDRCNVPVDTVEKSQVKDRVPPYVYHTQQQFTRCPACGRIYWAATHWRWACALFERLESGPPWMS